MTRDLLDRNAEFRFCSATGHMTILRDSIGRLIGPQGTTIKSIQRTTGMYRLPC